MQQSHGWARPWSHRKLACGCGVPGVRQAKPCRRLFSHGWKEKIRLDARLWACRRCHWVTYVSSYRPVSSNGRRPHQLPEQKIHGGRHTDPEGFNEHGARSSGIHLFAPGLLLALKTSLMSPSTGRDGRPPSPGEMRTEPLRPPAGTSAPLKRKACGHPWLRN